MQQVSNEYKYRVTKIEKTSAPDGMMGDNWYRYVIKKGKSVMECKKAGSLKAVTAHAKGQADMINLRNGNTRSKKK